MNNYEMKINKVGRDSDNLIKSIEFNLQATDEDGDVAEASWKKVFGSPLSASEDDIMTICNSIAEENGMYNRLDVVLLRMKQPTDDNPPISIDPVPTTPPTDSEQRKVWMSEIDDAVAQTYARFGRFEMEYTKREEAAVAYKASGYSGTPTHWITRFADNTGMSYAAASELILAQASALRGALEQLAQLRMDKYKILNAPSLDEARMERDVIMSNCINVDRSLS